MKKIVLLIVAALSIIGFVTLVVRDRPPLPDPKPQPPPETVRLRVVSDAPDAPPIAGARIVGHGPAGPIQSKTDAQGAVTLKRGEKVQLRIIAPRHLGVELPVDLSRKEQTIVLKRTGSVRIRAVGPGNQPIEGVAIRLLAPTPDPTAITLGQEPEKRTNAAGLVRWSDLPPGAGAEWICASGHPLEEGAKGTIAIVGGREADLDLHVQPSTTVFFRLAPGANAGGMARVEITSEGAVERTLDVPVGDPISIPNLEPGPKGVRAAWWDAPGRRAFAVAAFDAGDFETRDLGVLKPLEGESIEIRVRIDAPPEIAKEILKPAMARIRIASEGGYEDPPLADDIQVEAGRVYTLRGIPASRLRVSCVPEFRFDPGAPLRRIEPVPQIEVEIPSPRVEIAIKVS